MFCSLLEACANVQRTHKVHAFLLIERIPESFVRGDVCNLGRHRRMTSLGLASAISEFQTILSYKKSVSKEGKEETENKVGRPGGYTCYACFWKEKHPVMDKCYHRNRARF